MEVSTAGESRGGNKKPAYLVRVEHVGKVDEERHFSTDACGGDGSGGGRSMPTTHLEKGKEHGGGT